MLFHHLSSVCAILKYHMKVWNLFSNICAIIVSSGNTFITCLSVHRWLSCAIQGRNLPYISVRLTAFISLFFLWVPDVTSSMLPYLTLRIDGFSLSKTTLRLFEVFDLPHLSDAAAPDVRCCGTGGWKGSKPNPKVKSVWAANEIWVVGKG